MNKKEVLELLDVQPKAGNSILKTLTEMWNNTRDCRLRDLHSIN